MLVLLEFENTLVGIFVRVIAIVACGKLPKVLFLPDPSEARAGCPSEKLSCQDQSREKSLFLICLPWRRVEQNNKKTSATVHGTGIQFFFIAPMKVGLSKKMWGIVAQKGEREGGKKERKGEKERKRVELVISMRAPSFFEIKRTSA
jgi:hypothetical protein